MPEMSHKPRRNRGRMILIGVLAVSLLGNAVSIGTVLRFQQMRSSLLGPGSQSALFPRDYRREFNAALKVHQPEIKQELAQIVAARSKIVEMAMARPFDRASTQEAMTEFRDQVTGTLAHVQAILLDVIEDHAQQDN